MPLISSISYVWTFLCDMPLSTYHSDQVMSCRENNALCPLVRAWAFVNAVISILGQNGLQDNASVNSSGSHAPPPRANPRALAFFLKKMGKFPGVGTRKLSKCSGVGTKKEGKCSAPGIVAFQHFCGILLISE